MGRPANAYSRTSIQKTSPAREKRPLPDIETDIYYQGTSYDYSAPISEPRTISAKFSETKLFGFFLRAAKDLTRIEKGGNGTTNYTGNPAVFAQELYNVDNHARFYVAKHTNTTLTSLETFKLRVKTSEGDLTIPQYAPHIAIDGRQAKVLVSDFNAGPQKIVYSTAEVLAVSVQDGKPLVALWVPTGETGEFYLKGVKKGKIAVCDGCEDVQFHKAKGGLIVSFLQNEGRTVLTFDNGVRVVLMDRSTAYKAWQPELSSDPHSPLDQSVLVTGPYLVRSAEEKGKTLALTGDWSSETDLEVYAPKRYSKLTFNGQEIKVKKTKYGSLRGTLAASKVTVESITSILPTLEWKVSDALPERSLDYDDSGAAWVAADKNSTLNPRQPATFPVLYADEYGFHAQNILWRGHFTVNNSTGASAPTGVFLDVIGGTSHGWSAYLNGAFLGSTFGNVSLAQSNRTLAFGNAAKQGENVLFVIQDNMGHDQTTGALNPRGILNATLLGGNGDNVFAAWKVAGKAGGQSNIDPVRGAYNEGGLTAERLGWHLPGFDDSEWTAGSPGEGFAEAGAKFYRSVFELAIPRGFDVSLAFELAPGVERSALRAQLYVNGYMFGESSFSYSGVLPRLLLPLLLPRGLACCFGRMWAVPQWFQKS
jgi:beta-galactosidase